MSHKRGHCPRCGRPTATSTAEELKALETIICALTLLDREAQIRVLHYLRDRFGVTSGESTR